MPRIPRKSFEAKYFHIMVQGIDKDFIFSENEYKKEYIRLIYKYKEEFCIELLAFCIMDNHAHLLVYIEDNNNMSNYMQKINTLYAMYYNKKINNRVGHVFRNRFKSEEISNESHLINCIKYIHNNPVKANMVKIPKEYLYSSYRDYFYARGVGLNEKFKEILDLNVILYGDEERSFIDIERDKECYIKTIIKDILIETKDKEMRIEEKINIINQLNERYKIPLNKACKILNVNERTYRRKRNDRLGARPLNGQKEG